VCLHAQLLGAMKNKDDLLRIMKDPEQYQASGIVSMYFEGLGVLVREGLVDIRLVSLLSSGMITSWWDHYREGILKCREEMGFPRYMIESEYLTRRVAEYGKDHPEVEVSVPNIT
jgi:hypothetical protein